LGALGASEGHSVGVRSESKPTSDAPSVHVTGGCPAITGVSLTEFAPQVRRVPDLVGYREESKDVVLSAQKLLTAESDGKEAGAVPDGPISSEFSLQLKLAAGLSPGERVALSRVLSEEEHFTGRKRLDARSPIPRSTDQLTNADRP
jgi:hypothetical protein